jgi:uroporphyrinogen III methyltransferase/synthase
MSDSLAGRVIVNTRASHQAGELDCLLKDRGAIPLSFPCIGIEFAVTPELDRALGDLIAGHYDWFVITSVNTIHAVADQLRGHRFPHQGFRVACIGPKTAQAARDLLGLRVDLVPHEHHARALASALPVGLGDRVLMPASMIARPELGHCLKAKGAAVDQVSAYRTTSSAAELDAPALVEQSIDAVTFASPSAVCAFAEQFKRQGIALSRLQGATIACIGPSTYESALSNGFPEAVMAHPHTLAGLVDLLEQTFCVATLGERM